MLVYFGHHKCATRWTVSVLRSICFELGLRFDRVSRGSAFDHDIIRFTNEQATDFLAFDTVDPGAIAHLEWERGFHVIRDPRDMIVSAYFSHLYSHPTDRWPELVERRARLEAMSKSDGLLSTVEFMQRVFADISGWDYGRENMLEVRFENLVSNPYGTFVHILRFLDLLDEREPNGPRLLGQGFVAALRSVETRLHPGASWLARPSRLTVERLMRILYHHDFSQKSGGRKVGEEDVRSHYRKGVPGDWRHHLEPCHLERMRELYGDIVGDLGYDTTLEPVAGAPALSPEA